MKSIDGKIIFGPNSGDRIALPAAFAPGLLLQRFAQIEKEWRTVAWVDDDSMIEERLKSLGAQLGAYRVIQVDGRPLPIAEAVELRFAGLAVALTA